VERSATFDGPPDLCDSREGNMPGSKILVVEDERLVAKYLGRRITEFGHSAVLVSSGEEALEQVRDFKPNLVLLDIMLEGDMDGFETATKIKEFSSVPIVFLTAYAASSFEDKIKDLKPFAFLSKPFSDEALRSTIDRAFSKQSR
jgi:CheY-like chemotaxis protein